MKFREALLLSLIDKRSQTQWEKNPKAVVKANGIWFYLDINDPSGPSSIIGRIQWYEPEVTELLRKYLKKGMTFVDAGANIEWYTMIAAKQVGQRARN